MSKSKLANLNQQSKQLKKSSRGILVFVCLFVYNITPWNEQSSELPAEDTYVQDEQQEYEQGEYTGEPAYEEELQEEQW